MAWEASDGRRQVEESREFVRTSSIEVIHRYPIQLHDAALLKVTCIVLQSPSKLFPFHGLSSTIPL